MVDYTRISEFDFGLEMLVHEMKGTYPLEAVTSIEFTDNKGIFYAPAIPNYVTGQLMITGEVDGYEKREDLLSCVGRCWDLALNHK